jgi:hypothetical protein
LIPTHAGGSGKIDECPARVVDVDVVELMLTGPSVRFGQKRVVAEEPTRWLPRDVNGAKRVRRWLVRTR